MTHDPETRLREILRQEAQSINPAGDGLTRIQHRVAARRARARWLRPTLALGAAAVLAGAAIGVVSLTNGDGGKQSIHIATQQPTPSASPSAATTQPPTTAPAVPFPTDVMWPFATAAEASASTDSWHEDAVVTAQRFVTDYLGLKALDKVTKQSVATDSADVSIGRVLPSETKSLVTATTVHLVRWSGGDRPWLVTGATDDYLKVSSPVAAASVASPLPVSGPGFGVDESLTVQVRTTHGSAAIATAHAGAGNGAPWSADVSFATPSESTGAVVVWSASALDGAPARVTAVAVHFGGGAAAAYPSTFVGIRDNRVAVFSSRNGAALRWLTDAQPGGGASDPQVDGSWVYYLQASGTCSNALMRVPYAGGTPHLVVHPSNAAVTGYSSAGSWLAYISQSCADGGQSLIVRDSSNGATHTLTAPTPPPAWLGDPVWGGHNLTVIVKTGMAQHVAVYAPWAGASTIGQEAAAPAGCDLASDAPATPWLSNDNSTLVFARDLGDSSSVVECGNGTQRTLVMLPGVASVSSLAVTSNGQALLVGGLDTNGKPVELRWSDGQLTQLRPASPTADLGW